MTVSIDEEAGSALLLDNPNSEGEANPFAGQQGQTAKKAITTMITSWTSKKFMAGWCVALALSPRPATLHHCSASTTQPRAAMPMGGWMGWTPRIGLSCVQLWLDWGGGGV